MPKSAKSATNIDTGKLSELYPDAAKELLGLQEALKAKTLQREGQDSFLTYVKHMWPDFIEGRHHQIFAEKQKCEKHHKRAMRKCQAPPLFGGL